MKEINTGISVQDWKRICRVLAGNRKIDEAVLFGSRAKGTYAPGSDIDLALKGSGIILQDILDLSTGMDQLELPYKFDLIIFDRISEKALSEHIERVGVCVYRK